MSPSTENRGPLSVPLVETARRADAGLVGWRLDRLQADLEGPLCLVGAGGSRPVARLWAELHRRRGHRVQTPTPLDVHLMPPDGPVLILSASGRHHDILGAAEAALAAGGPVHGVCTKADAPLLVRLRAADAHHHTVALTGPAVSEGLAARHGAVPMALLAGRVFGLDGDAAVQAFAAVQADRAPAERLAADAPADVVALGAGLGRAAAEVFAHTLRESGLAPARAADPREFAHGQFVAVGPRTRLAVFGLAEQPWLAPFVEALPAEIAPLVVVEQATGAAGALALFARALDCAGIAMKAAGATPGREAIPPWGAKLYRMPVTSGSG